MQVSKNLQRMKMLLENTKPKDTDSPIETYEGLHLYRCPTEHDHAMVLIDGAMFTISAFDSTHLPKREQFVQPSIGQHHYFRSGVSTVFHGDVAFIDDLHFESKVENGYGVTRLYRYRTHEEAVLGHQSYVKVIDLQYIMHGSWRKAKRALSLKGKDNKIGRALFEKYKGAHFKQHAKNLAENGVFGKPSFLNI